MRLKLLVACGAAAATLAGAFLSALVTRPEYDLEVRIVEATDALRVGRPNVIDVEVFNHGRVPLRPVYAIQWQTYPHNWNIEPEPEVDKIAPGETKHIRLSTAHYEAMPPEAGAMLVQGEDGAFDSVPFVVKVNPAGDGRYWLSQPWTATSHLGPIINTAFGVWPSSSMPQGELPAPAGWDLRTRAVGADVARIERLTPAGVALEVQHVSPANKQWVEAALFRSFNQARVLSASSCPVLIASFGRWPDLRTSDGNWPVLAAGLQFSDLTHPGSELWFVLTRSDSRRYILPAGAAIVQTAALPGKSVRVDLEDATRWLGWSSSSPLQAKIFVAAYGSITEFQRVEVNSIDCLMQDPR